MTSERQPDRAGSQLRRLTRFDSAGRRPPEQLRKRLQFPDAKIGYGPIADAVLTPAHHIVSIDRAARGWAAALVRNCRQTDDVETATIHQRGNRRVVDDVHARADQRESLLRKID